MPGSSRAGMGAAQPRKWSARSTATFTASSCAGSGRTPDNIALKNAAFRAEFAPAGEINSAIATILSAIERELLASRPSEDAKTSMIKPKRVEPFARGTPSPKVDQNTLAINEKGVSIQSSRKASGCILNRAPRFLACSTVIPRSPLRIRAATE